MHQGSDTYTGPMTWPRVFSNKGLAEKLGSTWTTPVMGFRPAIEEMEKIWPDRQETASRTEDDPLIFWSALSTMYMVDTGRAEYAGTHLPWIGHVAHERGGLLSSPLRGYEHDISDSRLENVKRFLDRSSKLKWVNLQGPGLTTLTNTAGIVRQGYSPKIEKIARNSGGRTIHQE